MKRTALAVTAALCLAGTAACGDTDEGDPAEPTTSETENTTPYTTPYNDEDQDGDPPSADG